MQLTPENIREVFDYNSETGQLFWKIKPAQRVKVGDVTRSLGNHGYLVSRFCGKLYLNHRLIFALVNGRWPKDQIDHINHVKTDNRIANLREVSNSENLKNSRLSNRNKSGCTGVHWYKPTNKWQAQIRVANKLIHLGFFVCLADAIKVRKAANAKYGFHLNHGSVLVGGN